MNTKISLILLLLPCFFIDLNLIGSDPNDSIDGLKLVLAGITAKYKGLEENVAAVEERSAKPTGETTGQIAARIQEACTQAGFTVNVQQEAANPLSRKFTMKMSLTDLL